MTRAFALLIAVLLPLSAAGLARAGEEITTSLADSKDDIGPTHSVMFTGACGEECYLGSLTCDSNGGLVVELTDISGKDAAKAIAKDQTNAILDVAGKRVDLPVSAFDFSEMNGSWDITARSFDSEAAFKLFKGAKSFTLLIEGRKQKLPVNADVTAWLKACGH